MKLYWVKSPKWIRYIFPNYIWHLQPSSKVIYLTFDDGPTKECTNFILDYLKEYNAKATFFCIGENAKKNSALMNRTIQEGHIVANHTQHHSNGWNTNNSDYINECIEAEETLSNYTKNNTLKLFRPPYGKCKKKQQRILLKKGYKLIMWSVLSADFDKEVSKEECLNNIIKNTVSGSIVILHDSIKTKTTMEYVLPKVLKHFDNLGYTFKSIHSLNQ